MTEVKKFFSLEEKLAVSAADDAQLDEWSMSRQDWNRLNGQYGAPTVETDDTGMTTIIWPGTEPIKTRKDIEADLLDFRTPNGSVLKIPRALTVGNYPTVFRRSRR